jgi:hypothetical protein
MEDREVEVSSRVIKSGENIRKLLEEILGVLDLAEGRVLIVDKKATSDQKITADTFHYPYVPTKARWTGNGSGRACCQLFNNQPLPNARAMSISDRNNIEEWLEGEFNDVVRLWKDKTIAECVEAAAGAELFIGIDSGMSHLCHSVGVPVLIQDWEGLDRHHESKEFSSFRDPADAISKMKKMREDQWN